MTSFWSLDPALAWGFVASLGTLVTLVATFFTWLRSRRVLTTPLNESDLRITVMKPMSGLDPRLEENLETFAALQAPAEFEVLMCLGSSSDGAYPVAKRFVEKYPQRFRLVLGSDARFGNAKMAQLIHAWPEAKNDFIWVSESNVETSQSFMEELARRWKAGNAKQRKKTLVHAPLVGVYGSGVGAALERMHLASLQNPNQELGLLLGMHAIVGKTEFFHRDDMVAIGGLERFGNYLGEDYMMGAAFSKEGQVLCTSIPTRNVLGPLTVSAWFDRHARWAVMRKTMVGGAFFILEPQNTLWFVTLFFAAGVIPAWLWGMLLGARLFIDGVNYSIQTGELPRLGDVLLVPFKELLLFLAWLNACFTFHVKWRADRAIQLGYQSVVLSKSANPSKLGRLAENVRRIGNS